MSDSTFIAYAHEPGSRRAATKLAERLRRDGVEVWLDQWSLRPGEPWKPAVSSALERASAVVVIVGSAERSRGMLETELRAALDANKIVIPVLTEDADFDDIPEAIRDRQAVAPSSDEFAYRQLLRALGKRPSDPDDLESLTLVQRLRRYIAND